MAGLDLIALANSPGYGTARTALKEAGAWDEYAGAGAEREFSVFLSTELHIATAQVFVKARCAAEAREKASRLAEDGTIEWSRIAPVDHVIDQVIDSAER